MSAATIAAGPTSNGEWRRGQEVKSKAQAGSKKAGKKKGFGSAKGTATGVTIDLQASAGANAFPEAMLRQLELDEMLAQQARENPHEVSMKTFEQLRLPPAQSAPAPEPAPAPAAAADPQPAIFAALEAQGQVVYRVEQSHLRKVPKQVWLCILDNGVSLFDDTATPLSTHLFQEMASWSDGALGDVVTLRFDPSAKPTKVSLPSDQASEIVQTMNDRAKCLNDERKREMRKKKQAAQRQRSAEEKESGKSESAALLAALAANQSVDDGADGGAAAGHGPGDLLRSTGLSPVAEDDDGGGGGGAAGTGLTAPRKARPLPSASSSTKGNTAGGAGGGGKFNGVKMLSASELQAQRERKKREASRKWEWRNWDTHAWQADDTAEECGDCNGTTATWCSQCDACSLCGRSGLCRKKVKKQQAAAAAAATEKAPVAAAAADSDRRADAIAFMSEDLRSATVEAVGWWLFSEAGDGLGAYVSAFRGAAIDGSALAGLDDETLKRALKVTKASHRQAVLAARDGLLASNVAKRL